ncbi:hypothetical protein DPV78_007362 [Talaromyces pinophilus]|nr:hypothetical protein DPV78_007362 [Talaromyces pinophilus]
MEGHLALTLTGISKVEESEGRRDMRIISRDDSKGKFSLIPWARGEFTGVFMEYGVLRGRSLSYPKF